jgi:hypothetical protein
MEKAMETNRVPQRMKNKLLAVLNNPQVLKEHQNFAAKVLQYYGELDADPKEDPEVRRMLAELYAGFLWSGLSSLVEEDGDLVFKKDTPNPKAPEYQQRDYGTPVTPALAINRPDPQVEYEEF